MPYSPEEGLQADQYVIAKETATGLLVREYWTGHGWARDVSVAKTYGALSCRLHIAQFRNFHGQHCRYFGVSLKRWEAHVQSWKTWYGSYVAMGRTHAEAAKLATKQTSPVNYKLDGEC